MNLKLLESKLVYNEKSRLELAKVLDVSYVTACSKLNGSSDISVKESKLIKNWLNLSLDEYEEIFL